jgi:Fe-S-cluster containining protein
MAMGCDPVTPEKILKSCPRLGLDDRFTFQCGSQLSCFGKCCHDVSIVLTPYDVLRLKESQKIDSSEFLEKYTLRLQNAEQKFPIVILKMEDQTKKCHFLNEQGCGVYRDRPWACRMYPLGVAEPQNPSPENQRFHFLIQENVCQGHGLGTPLSVREWIECQGIEEYEMMSTGFKELSLHDFWNGKQALSPAQSDMFYMACYDLDRFRRFVFETRFLQLFEVDEARVEALRTDDQELLDFGMQWLRFSIFGEKALRLRPGAAQRKEQK